MGVLTDYFRSPTRAAVELAMQRDVSSPLDRVDTPFDGVALKGIDDAVLLGRLLALIQGVDPSPNLTGSVAIYPPAHTRPGRDQGWASLPADSPWVTGPWVTELGVKTRDILASLDQDRIAPVAAEWATSEEFGGFLDHPTAEQFVSELRSLALRAQQADELLYCWTCL